MSILYEYDNGVFISHKEYVDLLYSGLNDRKLEMNSSLFKIPCQYNSNRNKSSTNKSNNDVDLLRGVNPSHHNLLFEEQEEIKLKFTNFINEFMKKNILPTTEKGNSNTDALSIAELVHKATKNSIFFSKDIAEIKTDLQGKQFDLILLDPPWWNKYIRRKRKKSDDGYKMLFNCELKNIPVNDLLKENGLVVVWCTNSLNNLNYLLTNLFQEWGVHFCGKWYWLKITTSGKPVCNFSMPPGKQPYEKIIFGCRKHPCPLNLDGKLVVSIPSAIHSHKPPLVELLKPFLPENPSCLEVFARYLLPGWTSYGNEVLKLQHESLFVPA